VTIRNHLLLLVAGALLPLLLLTVALTGFLWWQQRNGLELRYLERVRAMTLALDTELDASIRVLRALGASPDLDLRNMDAFAERLRRFLAAQPLWASIAVADPQWKDVVGVNRHSDGIVTPGIGTHILEQVLRTRLPAVSGLLRSGDGYETQIAVPVIRDNAVRFVMLVTIEQGSWLKFMSQYPVGPGATLTLNDPDGLIIARTLDNDRWVGRKSTPLYLEKSRASVEGTFRGRGLEGQEFYNAFSRSIRWGWTVGTGIPAANVEDVLRESSLLLGGGALLTLGLAVLLAFVFGRRIERPVTALGDSARALARGAAVPMRSEAGISEIRKVERAFAESGKMLGERQEALNQALAREQQARKEAEEASRAKDEFLAMLGHELRNPLNAITSAVAVLAHADASGRQAVRSREIIGRQVVSLRELVDDLLDVARVTRGKIVLNRHPVDLGRIVHGAIAGMGAAGRLAQHRVETGIGEAWIEGDATRLEQVVNNLLDNAIKYTPPGGRITVRVEARGPDAVLEIEDTGMGIAAELLPRVFDLFTQGERTLDRAQGGLGLGLALVRRLVELHGGTVRASSGGSGKGASILVRFARVATPQTAAQSQPASAAPGTPLRILVVEDNVDGRETLAMMLRLSGHEVLEAESGPDGVALAGAENPDVAIVDIGLPGFDGYEVARRIRASAAGASIRLVALTGYGQEDDRRQATAAGFDWFLVKPADIAALMAILAQLPGK
jgi:signal transduction histidine kinase